MREQQAREQMLLDQLLAFYSGIQNDIASGNLESAKSKIEELRGYLDDIELAQLPMMRSRRQVELFIVDSLGELVDREMKDREINTASLLESANAVSAAAALVSEGNALIKAGDYPGAREKYLASFEVVPALLDGYNGIQWIDARLEESRNAATKQLMQRADASYRAGRYDEAIDLYTQALSSSPAAGVLDTELIDRVSEAGYLTRRAQDLASLESVRGELAAALERESELSTGNESLTADLKARAGEIEELKRQAALQSEQSAQMSESLSGLRDQLAQAEAEIARLEVVEKKTMNRDALAQYVADFRDRYDASRSAAVNSGIPADSQSDEAKTLELLETKLAIVTIINSETVQEQYPDLFERMNDYLRALLDENTATVRTETLSAVVTFLDELNGFPSSDVSAPMADANGDESKLFLEFLEKLDLLLR